MTTAPHTILIVDDEPSVAAALRRTLKRTEARILTAASGAEALTILGAEPVDVLLADIDMPFMTGVELAARVRRQHPDIVRMLITGRGSIDSALAAINQGEVFRYLTKPWKDDDVRAAVGEAFARLEELRRSARADQHAERRRRLLDELEREHPGISTVMKDEEGVYEVVDPDLPEPATVPRLGQSVHQPMQTGTRGSCESERGTPQ